MLFAISSLAIVSHYGERPPLENDGYVRNGSIDTVIYGLFGPTCISCSREALFMIECWHDEESEKQLAASQDSRLSLLGLLTIS